MKATQLAALLALAFLCTATAQAVTIATVPVGNAGNPADTRYIDDDHPSGVGSVAYPFRIGKTEVTNAQYVEFLNAVAATDPNELFFDFMESTNWGGIVRSGPSGGFNYAVKAPAIGQGPGGSDYTYNDKPVVFVHWWHAARFANWLHNGQPTGAQDASTTEDGAYTLIGVDSSSVAAVTRNPGARWWLPSEDDWYKAAYYDPLAGVYYDYPIGANTTPNNNLPSADTGNSANFWESDPFEFTTGNSEYPMTDAGAYTLSGSPYGTFDQAGNVWEWNETRFPNSGWRGIRGGSWNYDSISLLASGSGSGHPSFKTNDLGFRVATIPEPSTTCLGALAVIGSWCWKRVRGKQHGELREP